MNHYLNQTIQLILFKNQTNQLHSCNGFQCKRIFSEKNSQKTSCDLDTNGIFGTTFLGGWGGGGGRQVINERELRDDYFAFQQKETIAQGFGII